MQDEVAAVLYFLSKGVKLHFYSLGTICEENMRVSRGAQLLWLWVSNRGESIPVGTRLSVESLVCYTFCSRWRWKGAAFVAAQTLSSDSRTGGFCRIDYAKAE